MSSTARYQRIEPYETASSISSIQGSSSIFTTQDNITNYLEDQRPLLSSAATSITTQPDEIERCEISDLAVASPMSCSINLLNTILGTGLLAMVNCAALIVFIYMATKIWYQPAALASIGLIPGILVIMLSAVASAMGLFFLSQCASRTDGRHASFFAISKLTWPGMAIFFDLAIAIKCFGVGVSYLIIIGDLMPQVGVTQLYP